MSEMSMRFVDHIGYHDHEGPAVDLDEREGLVRDLWRARVARMLRLLDAEDRNNGFAP